MEFHQLKCFAAVVEEGTISSAARRLNMSQPPVSAQIRSLEAELGVTLFYRGARRITLTDEGAALYRYASEILELEKNAASDVAALGSGKPVPVRLGLISSCKSEHLASVLRRFTAERPDASFKVREGNTFELLDLLRRGRIEMAIIREPFSGDDLIRKPVQTDRIVAYGQSHFFLPENTGLARKPESVSDIPDSRDTLSSLKDVPLILYRRWESIIRNEFAKEGAEPRIFCICDDARTCLRWAEEGLGAALVPEAICPEEGSSCITVPLSETSLTTTLTAVVRKGRILTSDADVLFHML